MKAKNLFIAIALFVSAIGFAQQKPAQDWRELLREDPSRAGNLHHHYEPLDCIDTPAPEGYTPFYVSHYGRHGSRYLSNEREFRDILPALEKMDEEGLLTPDGEKLLADVVKLKSYHEGMYGMLTQRGGREHREIAKRLYERVPDVFNQADRDSITCVSTPVPRCIQSMANFTLSLKEEAPALKVSYYSGERYRDYLNKGTDDSRSVEQTRDFTDSLLLADFNADRLVNKYFKSLYKGRVGKQRPQKFFNYIFKACSISQCLDEPDTPNLLSIFNEEELFTLWEINNTRAYGGMCNSIESQGERNPRAARILADIIAKADLALQDGSNLAADFRFAHDSGVAPLISLLALSGNDTPLHLADASNYWYCFQNVCMGTNLQIIFYKNQKGRVLVKFIHNEQERTLPALKAVEGVYYDWKDVRKYCLHLIEVVNEKSL